MFKVIILFILIPGAVTIEAALASEDITSSLICPCECAMVISTCDCPTAMQINKEITQMKDDGFSDKQIFSALEAEYGKEILVYPEKTNSISLWVAGASVTVILAFLGYTIAKRPKPDIISDNKEYEKQFEEEYRQFVSEFDELNKNIGSFSKGSSKLDDTKDHDLCKIDPSKMEEG